MNKQAGYTHAVTYYKKVQGLGWTYSDFKTTEDALYSHLKSLARQEASGIVRLITLARI